MSTAPSGSDSPIAEVDDDHEGRDPALDVTPSDAHRAAARWVAELWLQ